MSKRIKLTLGKFAIVSNKDFPKVSKFKWHALRRRFTYYAIRTATKEEESRSATKRIYLHRFILGITRRDIEVDHKDGNGLDCRRRNIRACTHTQNHHNNKVYRSNTSGYRGASWHKVWKVWQAHIAVNGKQIHLGHFHSAREAARAYNKAAKKYFGKFARLNKV